MQKNIYSLISQDEIHSLLTGKFNPKDEIAPVPQFFSKKTARTRPSKKVLNALEVQFLLSDSDMFPKADV